MPAQQPPETWAMLMTRALSAILTVPPDRVLLESETVARKATAIPPERLLLVAASHAILFSRAPQNQVSTKAEPLTPLELVRRNCIELLAPALVQYYREQRHLGTEMGPASLGPDPQV